MTKTEAEILTANMFASGTVYALGRIEQAFKQEQRAKEVNGLFEKVLPEGKND